MHNPLPLMHAKANFMHKLITFRPGRLLLALGLALTVTATSQVHAQDPQYEAAYRRGGTAVYYRMGGGRPVSPAAYLGYNYNFGVGLKVAASFPAASSISRRASPKCSMG